MTHEQFTALRSRAGLTIPMFRRLTGLSRSGAYGMGKEWPVQGWAIALVNAWYLMDGPTRDKLLGCVEAQNGGPK